MDEVLFSLPEPSVNLPETLPLDELLSGFDWEEDVWEEYEGEQWQEPRIHLYKPVVWGLIALSGIALVMVVLWNFADTSWSYAVENRVDLSTCVVPIRATLCAQNASERTLHYLERAALPDIWESQALEWLIEAEQSLEPSSNDATIISVRQELRAIIASRDVVGIIHCPSKNGREWTITSIPLPTFIPTYTLNKQDR